jgi:hypothetical protein
MPGAETPPPANVDDLFDRPMEKPAPSPAEAPAKPADDLFGPPAPAEAPAKPAPAVDDLFGEPPAKPAPAKPADDLFGEPAMPAEAKPAPAVDDLFGEPPAKPAPGKEAVDDLFGTPVVEPPAPKPAAAPDNPFGSVLSPAEDLLAMRRWVDDTGLFTVQGRLIAILDGKVRLLKENGRTCTVPMHRLSRADADFVQLVVTRLGTGVLVQLASK